MVHILKRLELTYLLSELTDFSMNNKNYVFGPFWVNFPNFCDKIFLENPALSRTTPGEFLAPCQYLEKNYDKIPRKWLDRQESRENDGQEDGQTLFQRTLPATTGGPIKSFIICHGLFQNYIHEFFIVTC